MHSIFSRHVRSLTVLLLLFILTGDTTALAPYEKGENPVPGSYFVFLKQGYKLDNHKTFVGQPIPNLLSFNGFYSGDLTGSLLSKVRSDPGVDAVEDNVEVYGLWNDHGEESSACLFGQSSEWGGSELSARALQKGSRSWGLTYLCMDPGNPLMSPNDYDYLDNAGKGVDVYVVDSGINNPAKDLENRLSSDQILLGEATDMTDILDKDGHGSIVASVIGGKLYGVAKSVNIIGVKATNTDGETTANLLAQALQKIIERHNRRKNDPEFKGSVVNMSLKTSGRRSLRTQLDAVHAAGISMVAAAGNDGKEDHNWPAKHPNVISVGNMNRQFEVRYSSKTAGSNYGKDGNNVDNVNIWAPGTAIMGQGKQKACATDTGTSFSAGYVSGILAIFYGEEGWQHLDPDRARELLLGNAHTGLMRWPNVKGVTYWGPDLLANTGYLRGQIQKPPLPYLGAPRPANQGPAQALPTVGPCKNFADPDEQGWGPAKASQSSGAANSCVCTNGATISAVHSDSMGGCAWTTLPNAALLAQAMTMTAWG